MDAALASAVLGLVPGLQLRPLDAEAGNRCSFDGLTIVPRAEGILEVGIRRFEATSLRVASGPLTLELGRLAVNQVVAQVRMEAGGRPRVLSIEAANAELAGARALGPLVWSRLAPVVAGTTAALPAGAWSLGPLAAAEGTIRAQIVDAALLFDADVKVPIRQGMVNFNEATVEHVGPDSRMGVSRMGIYVDAPNGRSYLYQFSTMPVAGVEFERRSGLPGPWATSDRGRLQLQAFAEGVLRQPPAKGMGLTDQARLLLDRTAMSGEVQLGDGRFAAPGLQAEVAGGAEGRNKLRLHAEAVGQGITLELPSALARNAVMKAKGRQLTCREVTASLVLRFTLARGELGFVFELPAMNMVGLRVEADDARH